jgi:hypothetical protein
MLSYRASSGRTEALTVPFELFALLMDLKDGVQLIDTLSDDVFANLGVFTQRLAQEDERNLLAWNPITEETVYELGIRFSDRGQVIRLAPASPEGLCHVQNNRPECALAQHGGLCLAGELRTRVSLHPPEFFGGCAFASSPLHVSLGHRRGAGRFEKAFSTDSQKPTIDSVAARLAACYRFEGFDTDTARAVLGDLLLAHVLENKRRGEGRDKQVQRVFPPHYFASWIDLPKSVAHLRGVPEMIVALMADQRDGEVVEPGRQDFRYLVGCRIEENSLLRLFAPGTYVEGDYRTSLTSDRFDESESIGVDQLLSIRLAQACGSAPDKAKGKGEPGPISNQRPIATRAARIFQEDLTVFLRAYGAAIPRLSLLPMVETCICINLANIYLSSVQMLEMWKNKGRLPEEETQSPLPLFVDCSLSTDHKLRQVSEQSMEQCRRRLSNLSTTLMYLRLLDYEVRYESGIPTDQLPAKAPVTVGWLDLLGDFALGTHEDARDVERFFRKKCRELADALDEQDSGSPAADVLRSHSGDRGHGWCLAEALTLLVGTQPVEDLQKFLYSCLMLDEPNGIGRRRRIRLRVETTGRKSADVVSVAPSNTALEFLVHRHLRSHGKDCKPNDLSLPRFINLLRDRYGFYIDQAPPDLRVPGELLARNRRILERRLRELGLLVGVNDAENMKRLRQRFSAVGEEARA